MTLLAEAEKAEDIGLAFEKFKAPVDDQAAQVTALISELYAIGTSLRNINTAIYYPDYTPELAEIEEDLTLVRTSFTYTIDDVWRILGDIGNGEPLLVPRAYRQTWKELEFHFQRDSRGGLCARLRIYSVFLEALYHKLRRYYLLAKF
jgi:hypothetical protein